MTLRIQKFALNERISGIRPRLNQIVERVNSDIAADGPPLSDAPGFIPQRILVLEIRVLVSDIVDPTLSRLECALPGQQLNPSAQKWQVSLPWTFTELTRAGVSYVYTDLNNRTADGTEVQQLTPQYLVQDRIMVGEFEQGTAWRDLNIDGRQWAKVPDP